MGIANVLGSIGKASEAIETYHHVIKILELSKGEGEELIVPLSALGNLLQKEGKASDAEYTFNRLVLVYGKCLLAYTVISWRGFFIVMFTVLFFLFVLEY